MVSQWIIWTSRRESNNLRGFGARDNSLGLLRKARSGAWIVRLGKSEIWCCNGVENKKNGIGPVRAGYVGVIFTYEYFIYIYFIAYRQVVSKAKVLVSIAKLLGLEERDVYSYMGRSSGRVTKQHTMRLTRHLCRKAHKVA